MSIFESQQTANDPVHNAELPIRFDWPALEKVVHKHIRDQFQSDCWHRWQPMLVASLLRKADILGFEMLAEVIFEAARLALARPIVLYCVVRHSEMENRIALLANGAVFVLRGNSPARFRTCLFPDAACHVARPEKRFLQVARHLLQKYAEPLQDGRTAIPSPRYAVFIGGDQNEWRGEIRFVTAQNWGFLQDVSGTVHSGSIPEWEPTPRSSPRLLRPASGRCGAVS